jgi:hypothetical protein
LDGTPDYSRYCYYLRAVPLMLVVETD